MEWFSSIINTVDSQRIFHFSLLAMLLLLSYLCFIKSEQDERAIRYKLRIYMKYRVTKKLLPLIERLIVNPKADELFKQAGLPFITSFNYNLTRLIIVFGVMILNLLTRYTGLEILNKQTAIVTILVVLVASPRKYFPIEFVLNLLRKRHYRATNQEVYSLYLQLKADYKTNQNIGNNYNMLYSYRKYFKIIQPSIELAISRWNGVNGSEDAWNAFAKDVGTQEAHMLALIMQGVENTSPTRIYELLEQKRDEFANANKNAFKDYLKDRENIIYFVIYACALSIFANPFMAQFLQYKDIMQQMNNL